jgi:predicted nucleic acid-binding protein
VTVVALDSNIMLYASGIVRGSADMSKAKAAIDLLAALGGAASVDLLVVTQALGEVCSVLIRNGWSQSEAVAEVRRYAAAAQAVAPSRADFDRALGLVDHHRLQLWDGLIVAAAETAGARYLLSEDMQDGFVFGRLTILNPLTMPPAEVVARLSA